MLETSIQDNKYLLIKNENFGYRMCWFYWLPLSKRLLEKNIVVFGIDNLNNYYDIDLKKRRLDILKKYKNFYFKKIDLSNKKKVLNIFKNNKFKTVVNLAAQAGVRFSLKNPEVYFDSNVVGFFNLLESCKIYVAIL